MVSLKSPKGSLLYAYKSVFFTNNILDYESITKILEDETFLFVLLCIGIVIYLIIIDINLGCFILNEIRKHLKRFVYKF